MKRRIRLNRRSRVGRRKRSFKVNLHKKSITPDDLEFRSFKSVPQIVRPRNKSAVVLSLPKVLSVHDNLEETLGFVRKLERAFFVHRHSKIIIDHSDVEKVTPDAALLLTAEFHRLKQHAPRTVLGTVNECKTREAEDILSGVGYNDPFSNYQDSGNFRQSSESDGVTFIRTRWGRKTLTNVVSDMVDHFQTLVGFNDRRSERLKVSLGECMNNVSQHAYPLHQAGMFRWGKRFWWLLGYTDKKKETVYFAFLDQGLGMPRTLRARWRDLDLLFAPTPSELVLRAFVKGRSRTLESHRGRGLTILKKYVDEAADGELFVQTGRVQCTFKPGGRTTNSTTQAALAGTLLVWQVRTFDANSVPNAS